jgi:hypothetical protein
MTGCDKLHIAAESTSNDGDNAGKTVTISTTFQVLIQPKLLVAVRLTVYTPGNW